MAIVQNSKGGSKLPILEDERQKQLDKIKSVYGIPSKNELDNYKVANTLNGNKIEATNAGGDTTGLATPMANETTATKPTSQVDSYSQFLQESLDKQNANVEAQRANDLRQAQINYQLMMKYLPEQVKYSGLGNDGNSAQFYLNANNQYQNNLANINSNADQKLNNNYAGYYKDMATRQAELDDRAYQENLTNQKNYMNYLDQYLGGKVDDNGKIAQADIEEYVKMVNESNLSDAQKKLAIDSANLYKYSDDEIKIKEVLKDNNVAVDAEEIVTLTPKAFKDLGVSFSGLGENGLQDTYLSSIHQLAKEGKIPDGTVVDMNLGKGQYNMVYAGGTWYKTDEPANFDNKEIKSIEKTNKDYSKAKKADQITTVANVVLSLIPATRLASGIANIGTNINRAVKYFKKKNKSK